MTHRESYGIALIGLLVSLMLLALSAVFHSDVLGGIGLILLFASQIQAFVFHRCPSCGAAVKVMIPAYRHCPRCGESME